MELRQQMAILSQNIKNNQRYFNPGKIAATISRMLEDTADTLMANGLWDGEAGCADCKNCQPQQIRGKCELLITGQAKLRSPKYCESFEWREEDAVV